MTNFNIFVLDIDLTLRLNYFALMPLPESEMFNNRMGDIFLIFKNPEEMFPSFEAIIPHHSYCVAIIKSGQLLEIFNRTFSLSSSGTLQKQLFLLKLELYFFIRIIYFFLIRIDFLNSLV